jgi:hypothetical protein
MPTMADVSTAASAPEVDVEKRKDVTQDVTEFNDDLKSDSDFDHKQDGVKKVEAVTSVWTKKTLWIMFALYVNKHGQSASC